MNCPSSEKPPVMSSSLCQAMRYSSILLIIRQIRSAGHDDPSTRSPLAQTQTNNTNQVADLQAPSWQPPHRSHLAQALTLGFAPIEATFELLPALGHGQLFIVRHVECNQALNQPQWRLSLGFLMWQLSANAPHSKSAAVPFVSLLRKSQPV